MKRRRRPELLHPSIYMQAFGFRMPNPLDIPARLILDPSLPAPKGMSRKALMRLAELREAYQWSISRTFDRHKVTDPESLGRLLVPLMAPLHVEHLAVLPCDTHMRVIGSPVLITRGDIDGVDAGTRAIFRNALVAEASRVIIAHNHPSGSPEASPADHAVTKRAAQAGRLLDVPLQDHMIIAAPASWTSLRRDSPHDWT